MSNWSLIDHNDPKWLMYNTVRTIGNRIVQKSSDGFPMGFRWAVRQNNKEVRYPPYSFRWVSDGFPTPYLDHHLLRPESQNVFLIVLSCNRYGKSVHRVPWDMFLNSSFHSCCLIYIATHGPQHFVELHLILWIMLQKPIMNLEVCNSRDGFHPWRSRMSWRR